MSDLLMREEAPLTSEEWAKLDALVVEVARKTLAGR
ncbi:MAG: encapsulin, partial [Anaerolineae bacterium]